PAVFPTGRPDSGFGLLRLSASADPAPRLQETWQVVRVNHIPCSPRPPQRLVDRKPRVVEPYVVHELHPAVRVGPPDLGWNCIDHEAVVGCGCHSRRRYHPHSIPTSCPTLLQELSKSRHLPKSHHSFHRISFLISLICTTR